MFTEPAHCTLCNAVLTWAEAKDRNKMASLLKVYRQATVVQVHTGVLDRMQGLLVCTLAHTMARGTYSRICLQTHSISICCLVPA